MNRIFSAGLLYIAVSSTSFAASSPFYAGLQLDNIAVGALLGYQVNKTYAVEARYTKSDNHIYHAGITSDTSISAFGLGVLAMLPMKLDGGTPYFLFGKAGYERINKEETYSIPSSVTLTLPYNDSITTFENRVILGGGVQYDFYQSLSGRAGIDIVGDKRSVYIGVIIRY